MSALRFVYFLFVVVVVVCLFAFMYVCLLVCLFVCFRPDKYIDDNDCSEGKLLLYENSLTVAYYVSQSADLAPRLSLSVLSHEMSPSGQPTERS